MTKFEAVTELGSIISSDLLSSYSDIEKSSLTGFDPEALTPQSTYVEAGIAKLTALANALDMSDRTAEMVEIFIAMTVSWGDRKIKANSGWQSNVSDDGAPFEFSIAFKENRAELRVLLEAQGAEPSLQSNWEAGLQLNQYLAAHYNNVSLDRFNQIEDLYQPIDPDAKFSIWHSVCFYPDKEPSFKIYLNPQARRKSLAPAVVEESLVRLKFERVWSTLAEVAAQRGPDKDEFVYFSLDLDGHVQARIKVYLRHYNATPEDLDRALTASPNYIVGDAIEFCHAMVEDRISFFAKPAITCFSLISGCDTTASNATIYIPIWNYTANDSIVKERIDSYLSQQQHSLSLYDSAIQAFTMRPLDAGVGMQSYISMRREQQQKRLTVYLNPEVNLVSPPRDISIVQPLQHYRLLEEVVMQYKNNSIDAHPFFQRLHREPVNLANMWLLFANFQEGIVDHFTRRLAIVVAQTTDENIRCILAKQLNEELGNGDISQIHRRIFDNFMIALEAYKPKIVCEDTLKPGRDLGKHLEELYCNSNANIGVGAAIVMEIRGKQRDEIISKELIRTTMARSSLAWLQLHEELELDHAEEAMELVRYIDKSHGDKDAARQGAEMTATVLWSFCNKMYRICFM